MNKTTPNTAYQKMLDEAPKRRARAVEMHMAGKSLKEIGEALGVSRERARQLVTKKPKSA